METLSSFQIRGRKTARPSLFGKYDDGDGTVPTLSALAQQTGGKLYWPTGVRTNRGVRVYDVCNVPHKFLAGSGRSRPQLAWYSNELAAFLRDGTLPKFEPKTCKPEGDLIEVGQDFGPLARGSKALRERAIRVKYASKTYTLEQAKTLGVLDAYTLGSRLEIVTDRDLGVEVLLRGRGVALRSSHLRGRAAGPSRYYGPFRGQVRIDTRKGLRVLRGRRVVRPRKPDPRPPRTRVTRIRRGPVLYVRARARDTSGARTYYQFGLHGRIRLWRGSLRLRRGQARRFYYFSVDAFGNEESLRRLAR